PRRTFTPLAWEVDNSIQLKSGEVRIALEKVHVEGTSFRQICQEAGNDEERIKEKIKDIVIRRGKLHNPVTDTGGLYCGVVDEIGPGYKNTKGLKPGDEVICNTSLAGIPMYIDKITAIDKFYPQFDAEGYAISLPGMPVIKRPKDLPIDLLLFTFNESGTIYTVSKGAKDKKRFAVIANNVMMALIYGYTIRNAAGPDAEIYCILDRNTPVSLKGPKIEEIKKKIFNNISYVNVMRPAECLMKFRGTPLMDMVVNCADIPGAETLSVMATKSGGTVIFANFISNYNIALYVTEATSKDLNIRCADGYLEEYDEFDFEIVRGLAPYVEGNLVPREKIVRGGQRSEVAREILDQYNQHNLVETEDFIAVSPKMRTVLDEIMSVSKYDCNVLITGATGVGKEKVANIIQKNSRRKMQPFVKINCASISPNLIESEFFGYEKGAFTGADTKGKIGYFEAADNGIIFLDEVGELPLDMQAKLLRVIQDGEFLKVGGTKPVKTDVRIISATNKDLSELVERRRFRRDLYYRLNVFPVRVPALDERVEDIGPLAENFISKYNEKFGMNKYIDEEAKERLESHKWSGNIRELENVIQRLLIASSSDAITVLDVVKELDGGLMGTVDVPASSEDDSEGMIDLTRMVEAFEKNIIREACEKYGSTRKAAKAIGISQTQLVRKKNKYDL
ncbi:MAG: sigma 54-interacting transcriptional regulator, partial [Bacillota bacterium]